MKCIVCNSENKVKACYECGQIICSTCMDGDVCFPCLISGAIGRLLGKEIKQRLLGGV